MNPYNISNIVVDRAEGPSELCTKTTHNTLEDAKARLHAIIASVPKDRGGYYKCDVIVTFQDGGVYKMRYDAGHPMGHYFVSPDMIEHRIAARHARLNQVAAS